MRRLWLSDVSHSTNLDVPTTGSTSYRLCVSGASVLESAAVVLGQIGTGSLPSLGGVLQQHRERL